MAKDRQPKYCNLKLSDDDEEETLDLLDKSNFKIMCAMPLTMSIIHGGAVDTDSA